MKYIVIEQFADLLDNGHVYHPGNTFPRDGVTVKKNRLQELASDENKLHRPLIKVGDKVEKEADKPFDEEVTAPEVKYTKTEINRMTKERLIELANDNGIADPEDYSGTELKKMLFEKMGL